ncbi:C15 family peptidase [Tenacibaculum ovolyticum]|uniref:hypothetical protein n=1 Tax=Tenacibaculum ovolyticum TaxID=104270 RepID=UPI001F1CC8F2|nr:hypothetical protein [Tenacibaculum ovolyticum]
MGGKIVKIAKGNYLEKATNINYYSGGDINTIAGKRINETAGEGIFMGDAEAAPESTLTTHPDIEKIEFIDAENNSVLNQSTINGVENGNATQFIYGKKLIIKVTLKKAPKEKLKIDLKLKGKSKNTTQKFIGIDKLKWSLTFESKTVETEAFTLPLDWYNEDFEKYNYDTHKTIIDANDLNSFSLSVFYNYKIAFLPKNINHLKPVSYRRNYEELIGLFKTDNSADKDLVSNYENKFIAYDAGIETLVKEFLEFIQTENLKIDAIKKRVETDAKKLWKFAVKQVQSGNLDDRPLYWARNKMQTWLKRNPLFKDQINIEKSLIKKGTELNNIIILFEELSRNYTGIDFSKAGNKKKVLITGFDPFLLNSIDHPDKEWYNIQQSNPSGCVALALTNNNELDANIQTMMFPVRYADFDGSTDSKAGQGEGVVEKYIEPFINKVDMIITISQAGEGDYNIDLVSTNRRGGGDENMNYIRKQFSKSIDSTIEWIETSLPKEYFIKAPKVKVNDRWQDIDFEKREYIQKTGLPKDKTTIVYSGSGSNYLSNEIFFRVAKLRVELKPTLPTGHFHINKYQNVIHEKDESGNYIKVNGKVVVKLREDYDNSEANNLLGVVKEGIKQGIKGL